MKRICILSGKGGVGKSTVAFNLAIALNHLNYKVGLLDIDIHCPNIPTIANLPTNIQTFVKWEKIIPVKKDDIEFVSFGFSIPDNTPVLWDGKEKREVVEQFLTLSAWSPDLDFLIVDCPAGTGDELYQVMHQGCDGAIVVTNPDPMALADSLRAKFVVLEYMAPFLGLIVNKSYYECSHCLKKTRISEDYLHWKREDILAELPNDFDVIKSNIIFNFIEVARLVLERLKTAKVVKPYSKIPKSAKIKKQITKAVINKLA